MIVGPRYNKNSQKAEQKEERNFNKKDNGHHIPTTIHPSQVY